MLPIAFLAATLAAAAVVAAPAVHLPPITARVPAPAYVDRGRAVEVFAGTHEVEPGLVPVTLRYPDGRTFPVAVDDTAIVQTPDIALAEATYGLSRVEELMPVEGLWVVRGARGEHGAALAVRLAPHVGSASLVQASPNLWLHRRTYGEVRQPNDEHYPAQWFWDDLRMPEAWALEWGSEAVGIAVLDTGCDTAHEDLKQKYASGRDVVNNDADPGIASREDGASHGTACAGLVAAATDNEKGVSGACPNCRIHCIRMLPVPSRAQPIAKDVAAFQFVISSGAAVASNSWGYDERVPAPGPLATAITAAYERGRGGLGAVIVFAAGNEDREVFDDELLGLPGVLAVGAITHYQEVTSYSNRGGPVDLVAPVGSVTADLTGSNGDGPGDYTASFGGTSSACPIVAGIAGLVVSAAPEKTAAEIEEVLLANLSPALYGIPDENGHDAYFGFGIIDPVRVLKSVKGIVDPPPEEPDAGTPETPDGGAGGGGEVAGGCGCAGGNASVFEMFAVLALAIRRRRV